MEVPCPMCRPGHLLIRTAVSLISTGTERMLLDFGRASLLNKARQQPDKVRAVLDKVSTDGLQTTIDAVKSKLKQPLTMGYSNVGVVLEVGRGVEGFAVGDRVVSNGAHAEVVCVPKNLCAKIPDGVPDDAAAFTVVGSIGLQGIRLLQPQLGDCVVVIGLGLIGLMSVQLLIAQGCRVLGIDLDADKLALATKLGAAACNPSAGEDPLDAAAAFSRGRGVDGVLIAASSKSSDPVSQAAKMSRQRGRIVLVGATGLTLTRDDFYQKELTFQVSCSYGPGRYDSSYELKGQDYPIGFVRWTEQRNFEAVLDMLAEGRIDIESMISDRFEISKAAIAYDRLAEDRKLMALLLEYPARDTSTDRFVAFRSVPTTQPDAVAPVVACIGSGNYASRILLPAFARTGVRLKTIVSSGGVSSAVTGARLDFENSATDTASVFDDDEIDTVVIATRPDTHARFVIDALDKGKNVFVEKPLALNLSELDDVEKSYRRAASNGQEPRLLVGFNRRFAPLVVKLETLLRTSSEPMALIYTCNAGAIPAGSWIQDPKIGGGRIVGEACHFIDLARFLCAQPIVGVESVGMGAGDKLVDTRDVATIIVKFENGSIATVHYYANGHAKFPKERIEVFQAGRVLCLNNFRSLTAFGVPGFKTVKSWKQNKGQQECAAGFVDALQKGNSSPIAFSELIDVSKVSIEAANLMRNEKTDQDSTP